MKPIEIPIELINKFLNKHVVTLKVKDPFNSENFAEFKVKYTLTGTKNIYFRGDFDEFVIYRLYILDKSGSNKYYNESENIRLRVTADIELKNILKYFGVFLQCMSTEVIDVSKI